MVQQHALQGLPGIPTLFRAATPRRPAIFPKPLRVLAIETSADDTCVALFKCSAGTRPGRLAYSERVSCPNHELRGIHPVEAVKSHTKHLPALVHKAMQSLVAATHHAGYIPISTEEVISSSARGLHFDSRTLDCPPPYLFRKPDLIAVTRGPGMGGCLSVGVNTAKALAVAWSVPVIGVHHMQAHALTPLMERELYEDPSARSPEKSYPFLTLLVSGKHTMLVYTKSALSHRILASVEGIALGDVLDKFSREVLPRGFVPKGATTVVYPKLMERFVQMLDPTANYQAPPTRHQELLSYKSWYGWEIRPPLAESKELVYNFTSLHGNTLQLLSQKPDMSNNERRELALHTMRLAFEHVISRVVLALQNDSELVAQRPKTLVLSGGVASNMFLRKVAQSMLAARGFEDIKLIAPSQQFCTDNAAMIAYAGAEMFRDGWISSHEFTPMNTWSIEEIISGADCWIPPPESATLTGTDAATERAQRLGQSDSAHVARSEPVAPEKTSIEEEDEPEEALTEMKDSVPLSATKDTIALRKELDKMTKKVFAKSDKHKNHKGEPRGDPRPSNEPNVPSSLGEHKTFSTQKNPNVPSTTPVANPDAAAPVPEIANAETFRRVMQTPPRTLIWTSSRSLLRPGPPRGQPRIREQDEPVDEVQPTIEIELGNVTGQRAKSSQEQSKSRARRARPKQQQPPQTPTAETKTEQTLGLPGKKCRMKSPKTQDEPSSTQTDTTSSSSNGDDKRSKHKTKIKLIGHLEEPQPQQTQQPQQFLSALQRFKAFLQGR